MDQSPLRDLAAQIEELARKHPCWSQVHTHVYCLTDYITARAFIEENRHKEVEENKQRYTLAIDDSKVRLIKKGEPL
jgi:hypothetical protein